MPPIEEHRQMSLTEADIDAIRGVSCQCPHGMTSKDIFRLREFLDYWDRTKSAVGGYVIKTFIILTVCIGVMVAWITNK